MREKLEEKPRKIPSHVNRKDPIIVDRTIESWYVAGSNINFAHESIRSVEGISKQKFKKLCGGTRIQTREKMQEIIKFFDTDKAIRQSESFKYFYNTVNSMLKS